MGKTSSGTWVERDLFRSKAFFALSGAAAQILINFLGKRIIKNISGKKKQNEKVCTNCDELTFTYIEAQKNFGITKARFTRAIDELLAKGFVTINHHGGTYRHDKTVYGLVDRWRLWTPGKVFEKRPKESVQRGYCNPKRRTKTKLAHESEPIHTHESELIPAALDSEYGPQNLYGLN
ncbi:MAG: hypothetical protein JRG88_05650 [Deltaproteobacteria bacterium]|nr:hypothetical protein [Deltaproteobacteria bacterium]